MGNYPEIFKFPGNPIGECPACNGHSVATNNVVNSFLYGVGKNAVELSCTFPVHRCRDCGFEFTDEKAEDARDLAIRKHLGVLTADQIRTLRESYGLSRREFGELTRIGEASLARWESGEIIQNSGYDQFLYLLGFSENLQRLREKLLSRNAGSDEDLTGINLKNRFPSIKDHAKVVEIASAWKLRRAS